MTTALSHTDGRTARSLRTRDAVVEAFLTLIDEGHLRPTAKEVSERAQVSLRSVFQHFADLETLFAAASDRQVERLAHITVEVPADMSFEQRIEMFVDGRCRVLEAVSPVRRAALLQEPFSAEIARRLTWARDTNRGEVERTFAPELAGTASSDRRDLVAALHAVTGWYTWETLRAHDGLSEKESRRVMSRMVRALLAKEEA